MCFSECGLVFTQFMNTILREVGIVPCRKKTLRDSLAGFIFNKMHSKGSRYPVSKPAGREIYNEMQLETVCFYEWVLKSWNAISKNNKHEFVLQ